MTATTHHPGSAGSAPIVYTPAQRRALEAEGDVLVSAAAGSGKTRVLAGRIERAVLEQGIPVVGVVAVTYTEKAAQEIRGRVAARFRDVGRVDLLGDLERASFGTIHGLCARLLRRHAHAAGLDRSFTVLDAAQAALLQQRAIARALDDACEAVGGPEARAAYRVRARYGDATLAAHVRAAYDASLQLVDSDARFAVPDEAPPLHLADAAFLQRVLEHFRSGYRAARRAAGALDFDDLQRLTLAMLADDDVATAVRFGVQRLLVDEFQDTNEVQCAILDRIGGGCTFMVGDQWQSIYRFRRADVHVFRRRAHDLADAAIPMRDNFRSAPPIIDVVNHAFTALWGDAYEPVVAAADEQAREPACEVLLVDADAAKAAGDEGRRVEAASVAARIAALVHDDGVDPGDIVVLLPRQTHAGTWETQLRSHGVDVLRSASKGYFGQQQVLDVMSLLAWVRNPRDDRAALGVLAAPHVGLGWDEMWRLRAAAPTLWDAVRADGDPRVVGARALRAELVAVARTGTIVDVVEHAVNGTRYALQVLAGDDGRRRMANMRKLIELAAAQHAIGIDDIGAFLDLVAARAPVAAEGEANIADEHAGAVRIMTVHAAKGLEFPYVFVCDTSNAGRPGVPDLLVNRGGEAWFDLVDGNGSKVAAGEQIDHMRRVEQQEQLEEDQRLLYVAMTRARRALWVTGTFRRTKDGSARLTGPIAWLAPALDVDPVGVGDAGFDHPRLSLRASVVVEAPAPTASISTDVASVVLAPTIPPVEPGDDERQPEPATRVGEALGGLDRAVHRVARRRVGEEAHARLAPLLDARVRGADDPSPAPGDAVAAIVAGVASSPTFAALVAAGARAEVPFVCRAEGGAIAGRFDALAIDGSTWWVVDYKLDLPGTAGEAWARHGEQLTRYARAARAGGASSVRLTLVPLERPDAAYEWTL